MTGLGEYEPLSDREVVLRRPVPGDAATVLAGTRDPLIREFMQGVFPHADEAAAAHWIETVPPLLWAEGRAAYFTVESEGLPVGWGELTGIRREEGTAEAAVWLLPAARRMRTATAALRLVCRYGFEQLTLRRIDAYAAADNMPVQVVGAFIGFRRAGFYPSLFRSSRTHRLHDAVHATLVPDDLC
ncbi:N-acetyltransferase [Kitasatospora sp. MMS16-BH015]|uniref:GNAT family N-acetyltransferase n=1 Tax=Kitasatospora sp. MMS16-BH015 TaxID=2018025 RepID=UPI000CA3DCAA|nr:GNAT family N-acetyltransferase [Kitasatospora sp. MMS16-BH015]AUG76713.1 N-acetyltransferase [Kitasatospora sp. MMS16-BH015]